MIPVLRNSLSQLYNTNYFVEEFASGLGVADLVFATKVMKRKIVLQDFEAMYYLNQYFSKRMSKVVVEELIKLYCLKKKKAQQTISFLRCLDLIKDHEDGTFCIQKSFTPAVHELYSIEAKLKDWKQGLYQAIRYKNYSHKTFLAISAEFVHRVDKSLLIENNVGLISVDNNEAKIVIKPKKNLPLNQTAFLHLSENFVSQVA